MDIQIGDILLMKKTHPCGGDQWLVTRIGADLKIKCLTCGHEVMQPRFKIEKNIRSIQHKENSST
jgi:hypothetical protein